MAILAVVGLVLVGSAPFLTGATGTAGAATAPGGSGGAATPTVPGFELVAQDAWTPVGGTLTLRVRLPAAPALGAGSSIQLTAYRAAGGRLIFAEQVLQGRPTATLDTIRYPLESLPTADDVATIAVPLRSPAAGADATVLDVTRPGVYPLQVELRDAADRTSGTFVTAAVVGESGRASVAERLRVAWVWPLTSQPSRRAGGGLDPRVTAEFLPEGRLGRQALALARTNVPVTLVPGPETLLAWSTVAADDPAAAGGLAALRDSTIRNQVLGSPYVPIDLPSLLEHGLGAAVDEELVRGSDALKTTLPVVVDGRTALARPVTPASLARLRTGGVDRVVLASDAVNPANNQLTTRPFVLSAPVALSTGEPVSALVGDPSLEALLTGSVAPALRAQQLLAGLVMVALDDPSSPHVTTLVNPEFFDPTSSFVDALLTGLRDHPFLVPVTVQTAFDTLATQDGTAAQPNAPTTTVPTRELAAYAAPEPPVSPDDYVTARLRLNALESLIPPDDPRIVGAEEALLASVSSAWQGSAARRHARRLISGAEGTVDGFLSLIRVPEPQTITLTSRSGQIPLTFRNDTGQPVRIRISLQSQKLFFPEGAVQELVLPPRSLTTRISVETRTPGTFPLDMTVTSADGTLGISTRRYEVRSTFVSTVGIALMVGAVAFLAIWWGLDFRRRHRARRAAAT
jgi:hypothetical protein